MKKGLLIVSFLTTLLLIMMAVPNFSLAISRKGLSTPTGGIKTDVGDFGTDSNSKIDNSATSEVFKLISGVLLYGAIAVAVIWGAILGINFITGTVETKATIKDNLVPYFVGLIVSFGAYGIWTAVINILQ